MGLSFQNDSHRVWEKMMNSTKTPQKAENLEKKAKKIKYYAFCAHNSHPKPGWVSKDYDLQKYANNAKRMHEKMNSGHNAVVLNKHV
jgi:hypothetical protein